MEKMRCNEEKHNLHFNLFSMESYGDVVITLTD